MLTLHYDGGINALAFLSGPVEIIREYTAAEDSVVAWGERCFQVRPAGRGNADPRPSSWRSMARSLSLQ